MLCIRLQRTGNRNNPTYRLVASDKRNSAKKKPKEILGHYLPTQDPVVFEFDKDRVQQHIQNGAVPSDTVARLLAKAGINNLDKFMKQYTKQKKKKAVEEDPPKEEVKEEVKDAGDGKDAEKKEDAEDAEDAEDGKDTEKKEDAEDAEDAEDGKDTEKKEEAAATEEKKEDAEDAEDAEESEEQTTEDESDKKDA